MAIRKIEYTVTADGISPNTVQKGGVQGEHNATEVVFNLETDLYNELQKLKSQDNRIVYRIDKYNGEGSVDMSDTAEFNSQSVKCLIEEKTTRFGGLIKIVLVITAILNDTTETELYTLTAKLQLQNLPDGRTKKGEDYKSMSTLAEVVKKNAEIAEDSKNTAVEAKELTVAAKTALQDGTEWVFDGGDAGGSVKINFVVDTEMSDSSINPVQNKVVKKYVDEFKGEIADYIIESGTWENEDGWTYRKWASGIAECWKTFSYEMGSIIITKSNLPYNYLAVGDNGVEFPQGLFVNTPCLNYDVSNNDGSPGLGIGQGSVNGVKSNQTNTHTGRLYVDFHIGSIYPRDDWTKEDGDGYTRYTFPKGKTLPLQISLEAKGRWK